MGILFLNILRFFVAFMIIWIADASSAQGEKNQPPAKVHGSSVSSQSKAIYDDYKRSLDYLAVPPDGKKHRFSLPEQVELFGDEGLENLCVNLKNLRVHTPTKTWGEENDERHKKSASINREILERMFGAFFKGDKIPTCKEVVETLREPNDGKSEWNGNEGDLLLSLGNNRPFVTSLKRVQQFAVCVTGIYRNNLDKEEHGKENTASVSIKELPVSILGKTGILAIFEFPYTREDHYFLSRAFLPQQELDGFISRDKTCHDSEDRSTLNAKNTKMEITLVEGFLSQPHLVVKPKLERSPPGVAAIAEQDREDPTGCQRWSKEGKNDGNFFKRGSHYLRTEDTCNKINRHITNILQMAIDQKPLTMERIERALLLANNLPGIRISANLSPANSGNPTEDPELRGASKLDVYWTLKPTEIYAGWDTYGSKYMGPQILTSTMRNNSLLWAGDQWSMHYSRAIPRQEMRLYSLEASVPANPALLSDRMGQGLRLRGKLLFSDGRLGGTLNDFEIDTHNQGWDIGLEYPLMLRRSEQIEVRTGVASANAHTTTFSQPYSNDRVRTAYLGWQWKSKTEPVPVTKEDADQLVRLEDVSTEFVVSKGLRFGDATDENDPFSSRSEAGFNFVKARLNWRGYWELGKLVSFNDKKIDERGKSCFEEIVSALSAFSTPFRRITIQTELEAQTSSAPLLSGEEFGIGSRSFGRAYGPGEISGDSGIAGKLELGYKIFDAREVDGLAPDSNTSGWSPISTLYEFDYLIFGFIEGGRVWNRDESLKNTMKDVEDLASIGVGFRWHFRPDNQLSTLGTSLLESGNSFLSPNWGILPFEQLTLDTSYAWPLGNEPGEPGRHTDPQFKINMAVQF